MKEIHCPSTSSSDICRNISVFGDILRIRNHTFRIQELFTLSTKEIIEKAGNKFPIQNIDIKCAIKLYHTNKKENPIEDELDLEELENSSTQIDLSNPNPLWMIALGTKNKTLIKRFINVKSIFIFSNLAENLNLSEQDLLELIEQIKVNATSDIDINIAQYTFVRIIRHPSATKEVLKYFTNNSNELILKALAERTDITGN